MKKLLAIVLVLCMVVAVAACGSKDAATGADNKSDATGQTLKEKAAGHLLPHRRRLCHRSEGLRLPDLR